MDTNTALILEKLAEKLGTTTEYIWQILLNQATISAWTNISIFVFLILIGLGLFFLHLFLKNKRKIDGVMDTYYNSIHGDMWFSIIGFSSIMWFLITTIFFFCSIDGVINAFVNPEYWAMDKLLNIFK